MRKKCIICKVKPIGKDRSRHHLRPKWTDEPRQKKHDVCMSCHRQIHHLFRNEELYYEFNTVDKLRAELQHRLMQETLHNWFHRLDKIENEGMCNSGVEYLSRKQEVVGSNDIMSEIPITSLETRPCGVRVNTPDCQRNNLQNSGETDSSSVLVVMA